MIERDKGHESHFPFPLQSPIYRVVECGMGNA